MIKLQVVGWPGKDNKTCWPVRRNTRQKNQGKKWRGWEKRMQKREEKAERRRHGGNWRRWSDLIQWACLLSWKGNPIIWHFHWPDGALCVCVCVCAFRRLVSLGWLTAPIFPPHSPPIWEHIHTDTNTRSRGNFSDSISLFEAPITIAAITVKGTPPPANRKSRTRPYTLKKRAVIWTTQEVELALY